MSKALFMAAAAGAGAVAPTYVDDVFSTYLYDGNGSTLTITNGIDLAGRGGLVWLKSRDSAEVPHLLYDSNRPLGDILSTNSAGAVSPDNPITLNSNGFTTPLGTAINGLKYVSWTFRQAPKFFDVVTFTGNGSPNQRIGHGLGVAPGCIFVKSLNVSDGWYVYHASLGRSAFLLLNGAGSVFPIADSWGSADPTPSDFGISNNLLLNGEQYVAYVFAHDPDPVDGMIQCGTFTTDASGNATVNLGWEPQWLLTKTSALSDDWYINDVYRGLTADGNTNQLSPNTTTTEQLVSGNWRPGPLGFSILNNGGANRAYIYIAIRRPNKPPTVGTEVYNAITRTGTGANVTVTGVGFTVDLLLSGSRNASFGTINFDRLRGATNRLFTYSTTAEAARANGLTSFAVQDGYSIGTDATDGGLNNNAQTYVYWNFCRAPGFFDVVCWNTQVANPDERVAHNLGFAPELVIQRVRNIGSFWGVYHSALGVDKYLLLERADAEATSVGVWGTAPTASTFGVDDNFWFGASSFTAVAYLFATLAGISKVGTYTGNGSSQTINCGFTTGARFVLIKRTDGTGDWYVWDTARGIVSGNDPHLSLNTAAAEVTTDDTIDPTSTGFIVNQVAATNVNVNAATYIFLAIA